MFVIFGLILLIIFIILMAIRKMAEPKINPLRGVLNELETGKIKSHVTACIKETAENGIEKIGANGGVIYYFEGGTIRFNELVLGQDYINYTYLDDPYFVSYALKKNSLCNMISYDIPDYPRVSTPLDQISVIYNNNCMYASFYSAYDGFYGENVMNKLCYVARESACEGFAKGRDLGLTIQKQLEDYVANKLPLCVNFSAFAEREYVNITVVRDPTVEANIHNSEVVFIVQYPLKITFENQEPVTRIFDYEATLKVRLGLIYNFLYDLLSTDSQDITFDINTAFISSPYWRQGIELRRVEDAYFNTCPSVTCFAPYDYDDILEITDRKSLVNGKPFLFRGVVENRKPALDLLSVEYTFDLKNTNVVEITFRGYDPDDTGVTYHFLSQGPGAGWRENDAQILQWLQDGLLKISIGNRDYSKGGHDVAILVTDDNGLYDYQWFKIKIIDTRTNRPPQDDCIRHCIYHACTHYTSGGQCDVCVGRGMPPPVDECPLSSMEPKQNPYKDCIKWCWLANNVCWDVCHGGFGEYGTTCGRCGRPIMHSGDPEKHVDCSQKSSPAQCNVHYPDCFWVRHQVDYAYAEECLNDTLLHTPEAPAYIILEEEI